MRQLSVEEMNAIKAGSGVTDGSGGTSTVCTGSDHDSSGSGDSD